MSLASKIYPLSQPVKLIFLFVAILIVVVSVLFSNRLAKAMTDEERKKIEIWAEAMKLLISADENIDVGFIFKVLEDNTTIPVLIVDNKDSVLVSRNFKEPQNNLGEFYKEQVNRLKGKREPFVIQFENDVQYVYYDDSVLIKQLQYFPFVQLGVIVVFLGVVFFAFASSKKAEQNKVWVGLSKETAHQLGTPISSLLAWKDLLNAKYPEDKLINEMGKDINRLRIIAERFSKIGSAPDLYHTSLDETLRNAVQYMTNRSSQQVAINCHFECETPLYVNLNVPLFEWVIENLCKNAIDAMDGTGQIDIFVKQDSKNIIIDVKDTGKGMERKMFQQVFKPGFTTKKRGWGLGLSLVKRIIEEYHQGKIFVKQSEINVGTTFRILLKNNKLKSEKFV